MRQVVCWIPAAAVVLAVVCNLMIPASSFARKSGPASTVAPSRRRGNPQQQQQQLAEQPSGLQFKYEPLSPPAMAGRQGEDERKEDV